MNRVSVLVGVALASLLFSAMLWASGAYWIDVRTPEEYRAAHADQAVNIPYEQISQRIGEVTQDKDAMIYVYCRSGRRAGIALEALQKMGYTNVINLMTLENAKAKAAEMTAEAVTQ